VALGRIGVVARAHRSRASIVFGQAAGAGGGDRVPAGGLLEVVDDDRLELRHAGELALDQIAAAAPLGGDVDHAHDAADALAVDHALPGRGCVAGQLDGLVRLPLERDGLRDGSAHERPRFQVALGP
jgi:hypothetical protein